MSNEQMEKQEEQKRIYFIAEGIQQKIDSLSQHVKKVSSDALEIRKTFWDDVRVNMDGPDDIDETFFSIKQQAELLLERERSQGQLDRQIKTLNRLKHSPYFGRVDFKEEGESNLESIYIGITSFLDKENENFLIYDWRAPISSLYYDYPPGEARYTTPEGIIEGDMTLKRQFIIRNSEIEGMFDTGVTIGDQVLQEVLGNNANTQMKSIVATIQREQNQIIRNEKSKLLIVQGVAGSGKTSAALQRIAYLLYRYRGMLSSQNIMLFSPNPLFNSYVATVLPELGEENMQQTTFQEYLNHRAGGSLKLEDPFSQLEYLLNTDESSEYENRVRSIQLKSNLQFKDIVDSYLRFLNTGGFLFKDIKLKNKPLLTKEQLSEKFYSFNTAISIPNRIQLLQEWIVKELKKRKKLEKRKDWVKEEIQFLEKEDYAEVFKKLQVEKRFSEDTFDDFAQEEELLSEIVVTRYFKPIIKRVRSFGFIHYLGMYNQLFKENMLNKLNVPIPENWDDIRKLSFMQLNSLEISYEDATPFVYFKDKIEGRKTHSSIRHLFIDEAQDYSPFQLAYLKQLFPNSKMTLLGDINQGIYMHSHEEVAMAANGLEEEDKEMIVLTRSYRSTRPIVEFTKTLLKDGYHIEAFNRDGDEPTLTIVEKEQLIPSIIERVKELNRNGHETIAIICKTAKESTEVYEKISGDLPVRLMEKGTVTFETGVLVIPSYLAKGIEFDAVIIHNTSAYGKDSERRLFYTACTRAMHELHLYSTE
ncbi:RNA polymerase recycling motor HelD [Cytobacillus solani]|uniref:Helicase n=1 Tax=Cytobacillus solani TaxID=1637975 RepID=A0A0Q3QP16_9BACI|nr:RNA polymerase recycling motor HelD [Cytobacillus solani]KQL19889.1 helicase [Cytobacillus solani]USK53129.1 AAA family ATPase [Cytobacillus solani]